MTITIGEASTRFLDDLNEKVSYDRYVPISQALRDFTAYLNGTGVETIAELRVEHIRTYLTREAWAPPADAAARRATWHAVKTFMQWVGQRKLSRGLSLEFARSQGHLRQGFMGS